MPSVRRSPIGNAPVGMASGTASGPDGSVELISMWVAPVARGRGAGDSLVDAIVEWAREQCAARVVLAVFQINEHALALYRRHGPGCRHPTGRR